MSYNLSPGPSTALRTYQAGSSLIEALVAVVILGFGLLAVGKLQITLANAIGAGRERIEASLLAQDELDRLRSFDLIEKLGGSPAYSFAYNEISTAVSSQLNDTNYVAAYGRGVRISANSITINATTPELKLVFVDVSWENKQGVNQFLTLPSVIARHDPSDAAWLIACQTDDSIRCGTKDVIKTPYNRSLRIPYPAKDLGGGKSAFAPPGAPNMRLVFNNETGLIEKRCLDSDSVLSNDVLATYSNCRAVNGYLLSGYISAGADTPNVTFGTGSPIEVTVVPTTGSLNECFDDSTESVKLEPGFISYACIIIPEGTFGDVEDPPTWSGTSNLSGFSILDPVNDRTSAQVRAKDRVCRFDTNTYEGNDPQSGTAAAGTEIENAKHPATYTAVSGSLENQNFVVMKASSECNYNPAPSNRNDPPSYEAQHQP